MVTFVFHTHLPYVLNHGSWPHGSDWLCEAVAECYLPLLNMCNRLVAEGIRPGITFDFSPILCEQLAHPDFSRVFEEYCMLHIQLAETDELQFKHGGENKHLAPNATFWKEWYHSRLEDYSEVYNSNILAEFKRLQDENAIELITCGATHGYLPLLAEDASVDLQIRLAVESHKRHFGKAPRGIWLPECAYRPGYNWKTLLANTPYSSPRSRKGIERCLYEYGLEYFITDEAALAAAEPLGIRAPNGHRVPFQDTYGYTRFQLEERSVMDLFRVASVHRDESVVVFARNMQIALQVWSGSSGYPGDPDYLDFHKKYSQSAMRYWRVTDNQADMQYKQPYMHEWASSKAQIHASHFVNILNTTVQYRLSETQRIPTVCLPFDTELFGHWWFEGPEFLEHVLREIHHSQLLTTTTTSQRKDAAYVACEVALPESSWGKNGNHDVWINEETMWTWEKEYNLEHRIRMLVEKHPAHTWNAEVERVLLNVFRQLLLAQASDWQFLITNQSAKDYATMRFHNHVEDALLLCTLAEKLMSGGKPTPREQEHVDTCEERDGVFTGEILKYFEQHTE